MQPTADDALPVATWPVPPARQGRAFRELYDRHFRLVWMVVRSGGVLPCHCEDVAQEVWLQVHRLVDRLRPDASARAWLVAIARRRVAQYHRARRRRERKEAAFGEAAPTGHEPHGGRVEARSTVDRVLHGMNEEQRLTFVLVHGYGLTGEEVASAVGDSVNTVYSRLRLARRHVGRATSAARLEEHRVAHAVLGYAQPPRGAQARLRALLVLKLGLPGLGVLLPAGATGVGTLGAVVVAGLTALRLWVGPPEPPRATTTTTTTAVAPAPATADLPRADPPPPPTPRDPLPSAQDGDADASPSPPPGERRAGGRAKPAPRAPTEASPVEASLAETSLAEETRLLKQAKQALDRGAPARALALLDEHARRFPRATLADVRHGARVRALCALGREAQARAEAQRMATTFGESVVTLGVQDVCAVAEGQDHASR